MYNSNTDPRCTKSCLLTGNLEKIMYYTKTQELDVQTTNEMDKSVETDGVNPDKAWNLSTIVEDVTKLAESNMHDAGFVYDPKTQTYYNYIHKCHYIPEVKLYYYHENESYYYYNIETQTLCFHSKGIPYNDKTDKDEDSSSNNERKEESAERVQLEEERTREEKPTSVDEDGLNIASMPKMMIEAGPKPFIPNQENHMASCIRMIVVETKVNELEIGTLYIITCQGGTLGRDTISDVIIPERTVSVHHASITYEFSKLGTDLYKIKDNGSTNGTFINGVRLSNSLENSEPFELYHGCVITVGSTSLECHIHHELETCDGCEPSCVKELFKNAGNLNDTQKFCRREIPLDEQYRKELHRIKEKFGLRKPITALPEGYEDKSKVRRENVGSSHPSEKTEVASVDISINKFNKGYGLLMKMGWKEGECLGKEGTQGIIEPLIINFQNSKAGLGSSKEAHERIS